MRAEGCDVCGWIVVEQNEDIIEEEEADTVFKFNTSLCRAPELSVLQISSGQTNSDSN